MSNGAIREDDYLSWDQARRDLYNFRTLNSLLAEVRKGNKIRFAVQTVSSLVGGIIGAIAFWCGVVKFI